MRPKNYKECGRFRALLRDVVTCAAAAGVRLHVDTTAYVLVRSKQPVAPKDDASDSRRARGVCKASFPSHELKLGPCVYRYFDFYSKWNMNIRFHFQIQTGVLRNQL